MNAPSWIRNLVTRPVQHPDRKSPRGRLVFESLEDRLAPATFTVLNTNDAGAGSLRDAVAQANVSLGADTIVFGNGATNFLDATPDTIVLTSGILTFAGDTALTTVTGTGANLLTVSGDTQAVFRLDTGISASLSDSRSPGKHTRLRRRPAKQRRYRHADQLHDQRKHRPKRRGRAQ